MTTFYFRSIPFNSRTGNEKSDLTAVTQRFFLFLNNISTYDLNRSGISRHKTNFVSWSLYWNWPTLPFWVAVNSFSHRTNQFYTLLSASWESKSKIKRLWLWKLCETYSSRMFRFPHPAIIMVYTDSVEPTILK